MDALFKKIGERFVKTEVVKRRETQINNANNNAKKIKLDETNHQEKNIEKSRKCC